MFYHLTWYILSILFPLHLKMMTWSHRNVVQTVFRLFSSLVDDYFVMYLMARLSLSSTVACLDEICQNYENHCNQLTGP